MLWIVNAIYTMVIDAEGAYQHGIVIEGAMLYSK
jgi:hypothetical protein